jgi:RNA polymerase sigma-70 factor (ECF subfamily)
MSTAAVHAALASGFVQKMVKIKACQLRRRPEFARTDLKDIQQELVTRILDRAHLFDPARGAPTTFIAAVIGSAVPMMCRDRRRLKRAGEVQTTSLDSSVMQKDGQEEVEMSLADQLSEPDRLRHRCGDHCPDQQRRDTAAAVAAATDRMPPQVRDVCRRLMDGGSESSVARDLGLSRRQVRNAMELAREELRRAGLEEI